MTDSTKLISEIVTTIVKARKAYCLEGKPIISDFEYDRIEQELKKLDPRHPILYAVGYDDTYDWWIDHYSETKGQEVGEVFPKSPFVPIKPEPLEKSDKPRNRGKKP